MEQKNILVVDDDQFLREIYHDTLVNAGYAVDTASSGQEALEKLGQSSWDLVLLDIIMPQMTGLEVVEKLKQSKQKPYKTLIFLTNIDQAEEINRAKEMGDGYLIKSQLTPPDLQKEVQMYLSKQL